MIYIENQSQTKFSFHYKQAITKAIRGTFEYKNVPDDLDVNVLIVDPEEIQRINAENRNMDKVTDVLSFPYFEFETPGVFDENLYDPETENILGDIIICAEKVKEQAAEYGHSEKREIAFLTVHSMLHLLGYDHMTPEDEELMTTEQKVIMDIIGIPRK